MSRGLISCGLGATDWWWGPYGTSGDAELYVDSSDPVANKTIYGDRVIIQSFNTSGHIVSITIVNATDDIILHYSNVSGEAFPGITYPAEEPTGWIRATNVTVFVYWEGTNTTVHFDYRTELLMHSDGTVCREQPGYQEVVTLGLILLASGVVGFTAHLIARKAGLLNYPTENEEIPDEF
ncbi:hypothetical protein EU538_11945 [Candidatus Thorarchaeota archaeon]|nr:MAG: hypothetical protein EU538_11945 [Candidatus Thorarchaeota archaeon]